MYVYEYWFSTRLIKIFKLLKSSGVNAKEICSEGNVTSNFINAKDVFDDPFWSWEPFCIVQTRVRINNQPVQFCIVEGLYKDTI